MKVHYDKEIDAIYIKLGNQEPDGVIEISEGYITFSVSEKGRLIVVSHTE